MTVERTAVIYDEACRMCQGQMRMLRRLDWFGRLNYVPLSSDEAKKLAPNATAEDLHEAMHVVTPSGVMTRGADGVRTIAARLPLLWPLAALLWLPGMIYPARWVYARIARNRLWISEKLYGCTDACALPVRRPTPSQKQAS